MEKASEEAGSHPGTRHLNLKKSFKLALKGLLNTCSKEEFCKAFPTFTQAEQARLNGLYIQVITALHHNIEDEFESLCHETEVGDVLDTVEELVEEQNLDPLFHDKSNIKDVAKSLSTAKKNEIQRLTTLLDKAEERKEVLRRRLEVLRKVREDRSGASNAVEKIKNALLNHGICNANDPS